MDPLINSVDIISEIEFVHKSFYQFYNNDNLVPDFCNIIDKLLHNVKKGINFYESIIAQKEKENKIVKKETKDLVLKEKNIHKEKDEKIKILEQENIFLKNEISKLKKEYESSNKGEKKKDNILKTIEDFCPVYIYDKPVNDWEKHVANKTNYVLNYHKELKEIIDKCNVSLDDVVSYIINNRKIKDNASNRRDNKQKIERCWDLHKKYGKKLNLVYFSLSKMSRIYKSKWNEWLDYLHKKINSLDNLENKNNEMRKDAQFEKINNKSIKYYSEINLNLLKKGEIIEYLNSHSTYQKRKFRGLCINCKIKEVEKDIQEKCNACISCEGNGVPASNEYIKKFNKWKDKNKIYPEPKEVLYYDEIDFSKYKIGDEIIYKNPINGCNVYRKLTGWCTNCNKFPIEKHEICRYCEKTKWGNGLPTFM